MQCRHARSVRNGGDRAASLARDDIIDVSAAIEDSFHRLDLAYHGHVQVGNAQRILHAQQDLDGARQGPGSSTPRDPIAGVKSIVGLPSGPFDAFNTSGVNSFH